MPAEKPTTLDYIYIILISLTFGASFASRTSLGTITDVIAAEYNVTSSGIGILSSSYWIAYMLAQIPWGLYLQVYNCQSALLLCTFGLSLCCLLFPLTSGSLLLGSIVFFVAGLVTGCSYTVGLIFAGQRFGSGSISIVGGVMMLVGTAHNLVFGLFQAELYERYKLWKPVFYVLSALSILYGIVFLVLIPCESKQKHIDAQQDQDDDEAKTNQKGVNSLSLRKKASAQSSSRELDNMKLSMLRQLKDNMLQTIKLYLNWLSAALVFCAGALGIGLLALWIVPYMMVKFDYSRSFCALLSGLAQIATGIGSIVVGFVSKRVQKRKIFLFVGCGFFSTFVAFIYIDSQYLPLGVVTALIIIVGGSVSFFVPFVFTIVREYNWFYGNTETAISFVNMGLMSSAAVTQFAVGGLLDYHYEQRADASLDEDANRIYTVEDFDFAFVVVPISLAVMLISTCLLKETNSQNIDYAQVKKKDSMSSSASASMDGKTTTTIAETVNV